MTESSASGKQERSKQEYLQSSGLNIPGTSPTSHKASSPLFRCVTSALNQGTLYRLLALCGVIAPIVLIILIIIGAAVTSGYNQILEPISQLAATGSPHPGWMSTGFITYGIMILGFGLVLYQSVKHHCFAWLVLLFFMLHGVGFLLGGVFSDDPRTAESVSTASGILHNVWIIIGCSSFVSGMLIFSWLMRNDSPWRLLTRIFMVFLAIILLTFVISQIPALASAEGVMQRTYGFLSIIIIEIAAVKLLISIRHGRIGSGEVVDL